MLPQIDLTLNCTKTVNQFCTLYKSKTKCVFVYIISIRFCVRHDTD